MVKITLRPWEEVVIHEVIEYEAQELFALVVRQALASGGAGLTPSINWADGVAFAFSPFSDTEEIIREKLKGTVHWAVVQFARVPEYRSEVGVKVGSTDHRIRLQRAEANPIFLEVARALKERTSGKPS